MNLTVAPLDDPRWDELLLRLPHDVCHTRPYIELHAALEHSHPALLLAESSAGWVGMPIVVRPFGEGLADVASPYGYASPLVEGSSAMYAKFLAAYDAFARAHGWITSFLRLHPVLNAALTDAPPAGALFTHGMNAWVDLSRGTQHFRESHRKDIETLQRLGFSVRVDHPADRVQIAREYAAFAERKHMPPSHAFDAAYFERLFMDLGEACRLFTCLDPAGEPVSFGLFLHNRHLVQYHINVRIFGRDKYSPTKLMLAEAMHTYRAMGIPLMGLGGGVGAREDSLYFFKKGFATHVHPFRTLRMVHLPDVFQDLTVAAGGVPSRDGPFPPYRFGASG